MQRLEMLLYIVPWPQQAAQFKFVVKIASNINYNLWLNAEHEQVQLHLRLKDTYTLICDQRQTSKINRKASFYLLFY